jgi:hypothetical protein
VFAPVKLTPSGATTVTTNFPVDLSISASLTKSFIGTGDASNEVIDRLRGDTTTNFDNLQTNSLSAEGNLAYFGIGLDNNTALIDNYWQAHLGTSDPIIYWNFSRRPGFFDEVCYTGTGSATTQTHNLGVVPELMIVKGRSAFSNWWIYHSATGNTKYSVLSATAIPVASSTAWNNTTPTSSVFSIGTGVNASTQTYVAYLFATCLGVSKVGSYTGTGATQTINCGFTGGARFVLIKRTDSTGDWYVWDTARGMVSGTDPSLLLNTTAAEVNANSVYTAITGFQIVSTAAGINTSGGSYIFLAIA